MPKSILSFLLLAGAALTATAQTRPQQPRPLGLAIAKHEVLATNPLARVSVVTRMVQELDQKYVRGAWADTLRFSFSRFTAANNPRTLLWEQASPKANTPFKNLRLYRYTINAAEQTTLDTVYTYPVAGGTTPSLNSTYTYNAQGNLAQVTMQLRVSGNWRNYARTSYTYNAAGKPTVILDETYFGTAWENSSRDILTYDAQGRLSQDEFQVSQITGTGFDPYIKDIYSYDANGRLQQDLQQAYQNGAYSDDTRRTFSYNGAGQLLLQATDQYRASAWQHLALDQYSYDADGNQTQDLFQTYAAATNTFVNSYRVQYTYERVTAAAPARALAAGLTVVPNPAAQGVAELRFQLPTAAPATVQVLDLTGRVLATRPLAATAAAQRLELAPLGLRAGLYLVRLTAAGLSQQTRLVVQ